MAVPRRGASLLLVLTLGCEPAGETRDACMITESEFWNRADQSQLDAYACSSTSGGGTFSNYYLSSCTLSEFDACEAEACAEEWQALAQECVGPSISVSHCADVYASWGCGGEE